jgi:hypothetical protein
MGRVERLQRAEHELPGEQDTSAELERAVDLLLLGNGVLVLHLCRSRKGNSTLTPPWRALELQALCMLGRTAEAVRLAKELLEATDGLGPAWEYPALTRSCVSVLASYLEPQEVLNFVATSIQRFFESSLAPSWNSADKKDLLLRVWIRGMLLGEALFFAEPKDRQAWAEEHRTDLENVLAHPSTDRTDPLSIALDEYFSAEDRRMLLDHLATMRGATSEPSPETTGGNPDEVPQSGHPQMDDDDGCRASQPASITSHNVGPEQSNQSRSLLSMTLQKIHRRIEEDPALLADLVTYSLAGLAALTWLIYARRKSPQRRSTMHPVERATRVSNRFWQSAKDLLQSAFFFRC